MEDRLNGVHFTFVVKKGDLTTAAIVAKMIKELREQYPGIEAEVKIVLGQ